MLFSKKSKIEIDINERNFSNFAVIDILLQSLAFKDDYFSKSFFYFRTIYFDMIDRHMNKMDKGKKLQFHESIDKDTVRTIASLSRILKDDVFDNYLNKMYSIEEKNKILNEINLFNF